MQTQPTSPQEYDRNATFSPSHPVRLTALGPPTTPKIRPKTQGLTQKPQSNTPLPKHAKELPTQKNPKESLCRLMRRTAPPAFSVSSGAGGGPPLHALGRWALFPRPAAVTAKKGDPCWHLATAFSSADTDGGLAHGQPELTRDVSKPQGQWCLLPHPPVAGGGPWETRIIHKYRLGRYKGYSGGQVNSH